MIHGKESETRGFELDTTVSRTSDRKGRENWPRSRQNLNKLAIYIIGQKEHLVLKQEN